MLASLKSALRWLHPGLGLKRWLAPLLLGVVILALGITLFLRDLYAENFYPPILHLLLLQAWPRWLRAVFLGGIGLGLVVFSIYQLNKTLLKAFLPDKVSAAYVADQVYFRQRQRQGPKVVVIGGGTGLSILLRGLKRHTDNIVAIVTVADDGGSSGKLRRELGVLPPGDFRNCIAALADDEALTTQLFQYRFRSGQGLEGHSFGNLFITAMAGVTGNFENALYESGRVLNIRGTILPSTLENVTLMAEVYEGSQTRKVEGESAIPAVRLPIDRVYLEPDAPRPFPPALQAILSADLIVVGPGSLYTSVIPNLLVAEIAAAIRTSRAPKIYICNVASQPGETDGYSLDDHVQAIEAHANINLEFVLANNNFSHLIPAPMNHLQPIFPASPGDSRYKVIATDVIDEQYPWRHDPGKLADELMSWYKKSK
jgi:uncharacterized cofD-like protein